MNKQEIEKAINYIQNMDLSVFVDKEEACKVVEFITEILQQQLNGGWIPVSERLPEIPTEKLNEGFTRRQVLVFTNTEPRKRIAWFDIENNKFHDDYSMFGTVTEVTQWQYLPDDPKEDKDAERN